MSCRHILFVDDDATFRKVMAREIEAFGCEVKAFASSEGVVEHALAASPDVALIDLRLPGVDGMELLRRLREADPDLPVVVLTGHGAVPEAVAAIRLGAYDFLTKPVTLDMLEQVLRRACEHHDLLGSNRRLRRLTDAEGSADILGVDHATVELRELISRVAPSSAAVLIQGENGTGKELVARAIHEQSPRRASPFVVVQCGAIPDALVESELFGHERGAFTGAERKRVGLLDAAHGGTVFLDEIGELPLAVQPVLLRALQFGEIRPVGAERTRRVDVRVLAATHRDLLAEVEAQRFREDLYYRLAMLVVEVPPLRARKADIPLLAETFLAREAARTGVARSFDPSACEALSRHDWPGNVRELENAVVRLATLARGTRIDAADVAQLVTARRRPGSDSLPTLDLDELERLAVIAAMRKHRGNKPRAAAELGVALKTLYNKLARMPDFDPG